MKIIAPSCHAIGRDSSEACLHRRPHADTAELEKALLVEDGFDVRLVPDLVAANGLLRSADVAEILLFAVGPRDGSLAERIIAKADSLGIPVVLVTTTKAGRGGWPAVSAVLEKPFDCNESARLC